MASFNHEMSKENFIKNEVKMKNFHHIWIEWENALSKSYNFEASFKTWKELFFTIRQWWMAWVIEALCAKIKAVKTQTVLAFSTVMFTMWLNNA